MRNSPYPLKTILPVAMAGTLLALPSFAPAQTFAEYLAVRNQFRISQAVSPAALETFVGEKVFEIRGVVRGFLESQGQQLIVLENPENRSEFFIRSTKTPDWLRWGNTTARLIVRASRASVNAPVRAELIAASADAPVTEHEQNELRKAQEAEQRRQAAAQRAANQRNQRANTTPTSRNNRPPRMPGNLPQLQANPRTPQLSADFLAVLPAYTQWIQRQNRRLTPDKAEHIARTILAYSAHYGVDPRLIMALVLTESTFNPNARSHAGAQGLGQLMPGTARGLGVTNSYDTEQNLYGTIKLLTGHLDKYTNQTGDTFEGLVLALAAYNAGSGAVRRHGGVPPYRETQNYVRRVIETYKRLIGE